LAGLDVKGNAINRLDISSHKLEDSLPDREPYLEIVDFENRNLHDILGAFRSR